MNGKLNFKMENGLLLGLLFLGACSSPSSLTSGQSNGESNLVQDQVASATLQCPAKSNTSLTRQEVEALLITLANDRNSDSTLHKRMLAGIDADFQKPVLTKEINPTEERSIRAIHQFVKEGRTLELIHGRIFDLILQKVDLRTLSAQQIEKELTEINVQAKQSADDLIRRMAELKVSTSELVDAIQFVSQVKTDSGNNPYPHDVRSQIAAIFLHCGVSE